MSPKIIKYSLITLVVTALIYVSIAIYYNFVLINENSSSYATIAMNEVEKLNIETVSFSNCDAESDYLVSSLQFRGLNIHTPDYSEENISERVVNDKLYKVIEFDKSKRLFIKESDFGFSETLRSSNISKEIEGSEVKVYNEVSVLSRQGYFEYLIYMKLNELSLWDDYFDTALKVLLLNDKKNIIPIGVKKVQKINRQDGVNGYVLIGENAGRTVTKIFLFEKGDEVVYQIDSVGIEGSTMECMLRG